MQSRNDIPQFLNEHGLIGEGVEVGVFEGIFSEIILETWKGKRLSLVDTWAVVPGYTPGLGKVGGEDFSAARASQEDWNAIAQSCEKRLARFNGRTYFMQMKSVDAAGAFEDSSLDFIYIDGDHSFESVKTDLAVWYPKLKSGGLFSGHDYLIGTGTGKRVREGRHWKKLKRYQVKEAVDIFAIANHVKIELTQETDTNITWFWIKP